MAIKGNNFFKHGKVFLTIKHNYGSTVYLFIHSGFSLQMGEVILGGILWEEPFIVEKRDSLANLSSLGVHGMFTIY